MAGPNAKARTKGQPRELQSRSGTPASTVSALNESTRRSRERSTSPYLHTSLTSPPDLATKLPDGPLNEIFDANSPHSPNAIPSAQALTSISDSIKTQLLSIVKLREETSDLLMRELSGRQKERSERDQRRSMEKAKREADERRQQLKKSSTPKKRDREEERPLAVGAHGVARQDGNIHRDHSSPMSSIASHPPSNPDVTMKNAGSNETSDSEELEHQPPPAAPIQQFQIFGDDPSQFPDSTIYEILPITEDTTEEEKKEIYAVRRYPQSDLHDLTAGTAPDKDFSNAKPSNQVAGATFANFVEPYLRPMTQEDLVFLMERMSPYAAGTGKQNVYSQQQDRIHVFDIPKRGQRHYKEIWADEDGTMYIDQDAIKLNTSEARGSIDQMNDDVAESDEVSTGPVTARWLSLARPLTRPIQEGQETVNGSMEMDIDGEPPKSEQPIDSTPAATQFPESTWKGTPHMPPPDYQSLDTRVLEELMHAGFLSPSDAPNYTDVQDDEVTARIRYLQRELRRTMLLNGARKQRVAEIAEERMATQEWQNIADDLDTQLNQAYLKRTRNVGKGKKQAKRPGGPGTATAGVARPGGSGIGEPIRGLMERRHLWNAQIGPVVNMGKVKIPKETIFDKQRMDELIKIEQDNWVDDADDV
ncbi:hypothetical protein BT63DRAFT_460379 [Microthyrium microscopicum]|uniref:Transcriptional regulator Ngg1 n=1 Tax=Microthyrium microscopicum TaxID=703497 RepID=A0A6A6TYY9_9PEZI|nr:hypothetical protein BT63DRAFT_460379 [Microthyrium microscopicum]